METRDIVQQLLAERGRITTYAMAILPRGSEADDVFQDVCLRAIGEPERFASPEHLMHWAMRVARHRAIDTLRKSGRSTRQLDNAVLDALEREFGAGRGVDRDLEEALEHCTDKLPDDHRAMLDMRYRGEMPGADIAEQTGRSRDAVYKVLARIHAALYDCITGRLGDSGAEVAHV
ncbi:MAG: sigma-70 family RNA polymerase sigma factor [Phycisphaera sp.]|nr:sigma-70 family RNA polymerase sigma factor [Phycisphaera sp.]